jgi:hypothetical protein
VVDFGGSRPYPAYLREHSPDYASYRGTSRPHDPPAPLPGFVAASELLPHPRIDPPEEESSPAVDTAHTEAEASPSPQAGRPWASGQLVFNAGSFESARSGFADYSNDRETAAQLRARVNRIILEDLEQKVLALRALHAKLRIVEGGASFGDVVAGGRPRAEGTA